MQSPDWWFSSPSQPYADDQLVAKQNQPQAVAAKILQVLAPEKIKDGGGVGLKSFR